MRTAVTTPSPANLLAVGAHMPPPETAMCRTFPLLAPNRPPTGAPILARPNPHQCLHPYSHSAAPNLRFLQPRIGHSPRSSSKHPTPAVPPESAGHWRCYRRALTTGGTTGACTTAAPPEHAPPVAPPPTRAWSGHHHPVPPSVSHRRLECILRRRRRSYVPNPPVTSDASRILSTTSAGTPPKRRLHLRKFCPPGGPMRYPELGHHRHEPYRRTADPTPPEPATRMNHHALRRLAHFFPNRNISPPFDFRRLPGHPPSISSGSTSLARQNPTPSFHHGRARSILSTPLTPPDRISPMPPELSTHDLRLAASSPHRPSDTTTSSAPHPFRYITKTTPSPPSVCRHSIPSPLIDCDINSPDTRPNTTPNPPPPVKPHPNHR